MYKRLFSAAAALALASSAAFVTTATALSEDRDALCSGDTGCNLTLVENVVNEGDSVTLEVTGAPDTAVEFSIFAGQADETYTTIGEPVAVTTDAEGNASAVIDVPALDESNIGGNHYVVTFSDEDFSDEDVIGAGLTINSANANVSGVTGTGETDNPWVASLQYGLEGDEFAVQALINDTWTDFPTAAQTAIDANGEGSVSFTNIEGVPEGQYDVRLYNVTKGQAGPAWGELTVGTPPEESPSPSPSPSESDDPTDDPTEDPTDDDDDDTPGLPDTGV